MNKRQLHCDKRLETRLESLDKGLRAVLREHLGRLASASADDPVEFMDIVSRGETVDLAVSIAELDAARIRQIHEALRTVRQGTYGTCEGCGGRISARRLKARPFATLCIKCKEQEELGRPGNPAASMGLREAHESIELGAVESDDAAHAAADELFRDSRMSELL